VQITCTASDALSRVASTTCSNVDRPAWQAGLGSHALSATATDRAGNTGSATTTYTVTVTPASLCRLVLQFVNKPGVGNSLCVKLEHATFPPFVNALLAQAGKSLTRAQVETLIRLVVALQQGRR
jgi:hypothetical protein